MIRVYDSVAALHSEAVRLDANFNGMGLSWYGGETREATFHKTLAGDTTLVPHAERLLAQLETDIEVPKRVWERSPAGAFCSVPDVIAGLPTPMRRIREIGDEHAPITILVCSSCSAGINADTMLQRGTTILALVLALGRIRPISLWTVATTGGERGDHNETVLSARINTDPLDVATAAYVLTSVGFARRLTYGVAQKINGFIGGWPKNFVYNNPTKYYDYLARTLTPDPRRTLVIGAAQLGDELLRNPLAWIHKQIQRFTTAQEQELSA